MQGNSRLLYYLAITVIAVAAAFWLAPQPKAEKGKEGDKKSSVTQQKAEGKDAVKPKTVEWKTEAEQHAKAILRLKQQRTARIETELFVATVSNLNAGFTSFKLKGQRYRDKDGKPIDIVTTDKERYLPLAVQLEDVDENAPAIDPDALWKVERLSERGIRLSWSDNALAVARKLEATDGPYQVWVTTTIANRGEKTRRLAHAISSHHYVESKSEKATIPFLPIRSPYVSNGLCRYALAGKAQQGQDNTEYELERFDRKTLLTPHVLKGPVAFTGVESVYFLSAVAPHPGPGPKEAEACLLKSSQRGVDSDGDPLGSLFSSELRYRAVTLAPGQSKSYRALAYLGPKMPADLSKAGHSFIKSIDLGFFSLISEGLTWLLRIINNLVGNWGVSIILLTLLVKIVLYPLTAKSFQSMAKMRVLKPEMDRINELYKEDREKKGAALMELYRQHKINPLGGCLPMLLQLPIWFALYASLSTNIELFNAPFTLWWQDLSSPDPYYVLPVALGVLMFVQQKMTPSTAMDPVQAKMMLYLMPAMMMSFMLFLPAGLCIYILTNSAMSIGQQRLIEHRLKHVSAAHAAPVQEVKAQRAETDSDSSADKQSVSVIRVIPNKSKRRTRRGRK
ncbi:MAG: membrane protein insertase YidC [Deltaproteobacteria bacterium]|nr:membrane protein insertase YidC [Deltaproteobacteria bacterium]